MNTRELTRAGLLATEAVEPECAADGGPILGPGPVRETFVDVERSGACGWVYSARTTRKLVVAPSVPAIPLIASLRV
jgi:hypothetical protein